jgi:hypothetical protein
MADAADPADRIGYKRPPLATQFNPGQSGNPKGRPKGAKNLLAALQIELNTRVAVTENGKRRAITKREAVVKQLVNKAASGDPRALPILLNELRLYEGQGSTAVAPEVFNRPEDRFVMESIVQRIRSGDAPHAEPSAMATTADAAADEPETEFDRDA